MRNAELQQLVEEISQQFFNRPFLHRAKWNTRLRTTGGRYKLASHDLDFNPKVLEQLGEKELVKVVKHELCHYHLHLTGRGYRHKDKDFKELLAQVGGTRFVPPLSAQTIGKTYIYECVSCSSRIVRRRRVNTQKYVCGKCHGKLQLIEIRTE
jgi:SprT-like protein